MPNNCKIVKPENVALNFFLFMWITSNSLSIYSTGSAVQSIYLRSLKGLFGHTNILKPETYLPCISPTQKKTAQLSGFEYGVLFPVLF